MLFTERHLLRFLCEYNPVSVRYSRHLLVKAVADTPDELDHGDGEGDDMLCIFKSVVMALAVLAGFGQAHAVPILYNTILAGVNEVPPVVSPGTGTAHVSFDPASHELVVDLLFSSLVGNTTAAHIHAPALPGVNAGVAVGFIGFPFGVTSGSYHHVFDTLLSTTYLPTFLTNFGGGTVAGAETALGAFIEGGLAYVNVYTSVFPGGEIRGQLAPVPEPATMILMGSALAGIALIRRGKNS